MIFNLFMLVSTHEAAMAEARDRIQCLEDAGTDLIAAQNAAADEIKSLRETNYALDRAADAFKRERDAARDEREEMRSALCRTAAEMFDLQHALVDIAAMETANCAHIGRKMAARARKALPTSKPGDGGSGFITNTDAAAGIQMESVQ